MCVYAWRGMCWCSLCERVNLIKRVLQLLTDHFSLRRRPRPQGAKTTDAFFCRSLSVFVLFFYITVMESLKENLSFTIITISKINSNVHNTIAQYNSFQLNQMYKLGLLFLQAGTYLHHNCVMIVLSLYKNTFHLNSILYRNRIFLDKNNSKNCLQRNNV